MTECERIIELGILSRDFFKEEVRNDFLVTTERKKIWAIEIDLLLKFDAVCKKHDLTYYLYYGTLLGAVRHGGFIPWDDDLDVCMSRKDYEKFLELKDEFPEPYFLQTPYTDDGFFYSFAKLRNSDTTAFDQTFMYQGFNMGIGIDIFPLDNVLAEDGKERFEEIKKLVLENSTYMRLTNPNLSEKDRKRVSEYPGGDPMKRYEKIQRIATQYRDHETGYVACMAATIYEYKRQVYYAEDWASTIEIDFEGYKFPVPVGYKRILNTLYGDYMKLPPVEERGTWHGNVTFYPDTPYKELLKSKGIANG